MSVFPSLSIAALWHRVCRLILGEKLIQRQACALLHPDGAEYVSRLLSWRSLLSSCSSPGVRADAQHWLGFLHVAPNQLAAHLYQSMPRALLPCTRHNSSSSTIHSVWARHTHAFLIQLHVTIQRIPPDVAAAVTRRMMEHQRLVTRGPKLLKFLSIGCLPQHQVGIGIAVVML